MRILLLTDSLSLARAYPGGQVRWEEIYVNLLRKAMPEMEFVHVGIGGATITRLFLMQNYYSLVEPDIVIFQCGIVDCAPRALGELEVQVIEKLHLFRLVKPFTKILRKYRGLSYTNAKKFKETLLVLKGKFPEIPFVSIGILPGCEEYDTVAPGVSDNIERYNAILRSHTNFIDNSDFPRDGIVADHHHMNKKGHAVIFDKLQTKIREVVGLQ